MNTVAHNIASKLFVAIVAVAMLFTLVTPAKAATAEEMQQMINNLLAQVAALQGQMGQGGSSAAMCPFTWTRGLNVGATGADVMKLQQFLNSDEETRVSASGVGSVGMETEYYGPATAAAVSKFQVKYRSDILSPAGLVNPTGYFGPSTMAKANALCVAAPADDSSDDTSDDSDDSDDSSDELSGEASLDNLEVADGDDTDDVEEGTEDAQVAEITVEFADGDAMVTRLDIALDATTDGNDDVDPWDTFDEVSLWVDGDEVARVDASDEDEYLDEDLGTIRFSGLDIVAMEDEEVVISVAVSTQGSLDGVTDGADWDIAATGLRYVDADDVTSTETTVFDLQAAASSYSDATAEFTINEVGAGDDLDLESSEDDPDATTFALDEDDNVEEGIFAFDLSAEDSDGDIEINDITLTATVTVASSVDDLVNDFRLEIDGESYSADAYVGTGMVATLVFDIDGEVAITADEVVTAVLYADFEQMELADEGSTIVARVQAANVDVEGADSGETITVDGGTVESETHTLRTEGADVELTDSSATLKANTDATTTDDEGVYTLEFDVTAFGDDLYIDDTADQNTVENNFGVNYTIENSTGTEIASTTAAAVATLSSTADETSGGYFKVAEGETETFTLTVEFDPATTGSYKVVLYSVNFSDDVDTAAESQERTTPEGDFDSAFLTI